LFLTQAVWPKTEKAERPGCVAGGDDLNVVNSPQPSAAGMIFVANVRPKILDFKKTFQTRLF
jgi:hypothetical protein